MESHEARARREARESLAQASAAEDVVRRPALPRWFFPVMAVVVAVLPLAQLLDPEQRTTVMLAALVVALLLSQWVQRESGTIWAHHRLRGQLPFLVAVLAVIGGSGLIVMATGREWVWVLGAALAAVVVLVAGARYQRGVERRAGSPRP